MLLVPVGVAAPPCSPPAAASVPKTFGAALRAQAGTAPPPSGRAAPPSPARAALATVERARQRLDAVLAAARHGRTFSAQELLALQADAYRYAQTLEVASKVVEQGAQAVKQAIHTQV